MGFKNGLMNLVTLGGHEQLEASKAAYEASYRAYQINCQKIASFEGTRKARLEELGVTVMTAFDAAKKARKILRYDGRLLPVDKSSASNELSGHHPSRRPVSVDRVFANYSSAISAASGAGAGAAVAAGSWSLVALIGSASTGTAIATLSGVAATNATLAWFGGGALAAGGAGMAGGTLVLGGVALAPVVIFAAWHSRRKTREITAEMARVVEADRETQHALTHVQNAVKLIEASLETVRGPAWGVQQVSEAARSDLFPVWGWSLCRRWLKRAFGKPFYSEGEQPRLDELESALVTFVDCFAGLPSTSPNPAI